MKGNTVKTKDDLGPNVDDNDQGTTHNEKDAADGDPLPEEEKDADEDDVEEKANVKINKKSGGRVDPKLADKFDRLLDMAYKVTGVRV